MRFTVLLILLSVSFSLTACTTTDTTGYVDPAYRNGEFQTKKVVVRVDGGTLEETDLAETAYAKKFSELGVDAIRYIDIVPPTRNYSDKKSIQIVKNTGADSLFVTYIGGKSEVESYVPPTYHPGTTTSSVNYVGNTAYVNTQTSPGYTTGGYSTSSPIMTSSSFLIDLKNGNNIWKADGFSSGYELSSFSDLAVSAGKSAINDLKAKGLISLPEAAENKI